MFLESIFFIPSDLLKVFYIIVKMTYKKFFLYLFILTLCLKTSAQLNPETKQGPYEQLIIRGATLINGDGSPPRGPVDIVIENPIRMTKHDQTKTGLRGPGQGTF